jgi:hypothetical protein
MAWDASVKVHAKVCCAVAGGYRWQAGDQRIYLLSPQWNVCGSQEWNRWTICDQSILSGGKVFLDQQMQIITLEAVRKYLP